MDNLTFRINIIIPGLGNLIRSVHNVDIAAKLKSTAAQRILLTIARQESGPLLNARYQGSPSTSPGPARGWWQFEQGGGVAGVLQHSASKEMALSVCADLSVQTNVAAVWRAIEGNDLLSTAFARLLLWTDPAPLTDTMGPNEGWDYYVRNWRPGKPNREAWNDNWISATDTVYPGGSVAA